MGHPATLAALAACSAFSALLAPLTAQTVYKLSPVDSVSVDPVTNRVWRDNRHRAYTGTGTANQLDIHGLLKFDLSTIPDTSEITAMRLICTMENRFGSPHNNPVVNLHRCADDAWTRATATGASAPLGALLTANQQNFTLPSHTFVIDVAAHVWGDDLKDDALTLAIDDINPSYSYVYFYGSGGAPTGPAPVLEITVRPCGGTFETFGVGGKDSTGATVTALATGCPAIGNTVRFGAAYQANATMSVYAGFSDQTWNGIPLPLSLAMFGAPGNHFYAAPTFFLGSLARSGTVALRIPNDSRLKGLTFYNQTLIFDGGANPMGLVTGPGVKIKISN